MWCVGCRPGTPPGAQSGYMHMATRWQGWHLTLVLPTRQPGRILNLAVLVSSWKTGAIVIIPTWRVVCGLNESIKLNTLNNAWHLRHPHEMLATLVTVGPNLSVNFLSISDGLNVLMNYLLKLENV